MNAREFYKNRNLAIWKAYVGGVRQKVIANTHQLSPSRVKAIVGEARRAPNKSDTGGSDDGNN